MTAARQDVGVRILGMMGRFRGILRAILGAMAIAIAAACGADDNGRTEESVSGAFECRAGGPCAAEAKCTGTDEVARCTCVDGAYTCTGGVSSGPDNGSEAGGEEADAAAADGGPSIDGAGESETDGSGADGSPDSGPVAEVPPGNPALVCVRRIHGPERQVIASVASASDGRVAVAGYSLGGGAIDFGDGPVAGGSSSANSSWIAVYDASCALKWWRILGTPTFGFAGIGFDSAGNLYVAGSATESFGFGTTQTNVTIQGSSDVVVAKYSPTYAPVWAKAFGDAQLQNVNAMTVDAAGNVYLAGNFAGTLQFGAAPLLTASSVTTPNTIFLARLSTGGTHLFSRAIPATFGSEPNTQVFAHALSSAADGSFVVSGLAPNGAMIDFGGGARTETGPSHWYRWVARYDAAGAHSWSRAFPVHMGVANALGNGDVIFHATLHLDTSEGPIDDVVDFGTGPITGPGALVRMNASDGATQWARSFGAFPDRQQFVAGTSPGGFVFTGSFTGAMNAGCGPLSSAGARDLVLARFTATGACLYSMRFGDVKHQFGAQPAFGPGGRVVLASGYHGSISVGGVALPNDDTRITSDPQGDTEDAFVAIFSK